MKIGGENIFYGFGVFFVNLGRPACVGGHDCLAFCRFNGVLGEHRCDSRDCEHILGNV